MERKSGPLRVGVVGAGAFGRNHARVYRELESDPWHKVELVGIYDKDSTRAGEVADQFGVTECGSLDVLIASGVDACSVAVPTAAHLEVAGYLDGTRCGSSD